jgi:hypothetical protein
MYVFVADAYVEDYVGGAELSTQGLIDLADVPVIKLYSNQITSEIIHSLKDYHWVFTNASHMDKTSYIEAIKTLQYSVVEYDYKFCKLRSIEKHIEIEGSCQCEQGSFGKLFAVFLAKASTVFWMSEDQSKRYFERFPVLETKSNYILSSIFNSELLDTLAATAKPKESKEESYLILGSDSWIKGTEDAILHAQKNNLKYEIVSGLPYREMLDKIASHQGLIFLPKGADTCPRLVIEAALMGSRLILNNNVQHQDEVWFKNQNIKKMRAYLEGRAAFFWDTLHSHTIAPRVPTPSLGIKKHQYLFIIPVFNSDPWIEKTLGSIYGQNNANWRCYIGDDLSTDSTYACAEKFIKEDKRFRLFKNKTKKYALKNIEDLIKEARPDDEEVIVILDGDDWLSNKYVLDTLDKYYDDEALVTFGSFIEYPTGKIGSESSSYPDVIVGENNFRKDVWRASHLKTLKHRVWKDIKPEDFLDNDNEHYKSSYDQAIMLPALELTANRSRFIKEVLCVYNVGNPNAVNKKNQHQQHENMLEIRNKAKYSPKGYD